MLSSYWQPSQALLVLSFSRLVVSIVPGQTPVADGNTATSNATIELFPKYSTLDDPRNLCTDSLPYISVSLDINTCLSGDYPVTQNVLITKVPTCTDGQPATLVRYVDQRCTGNAAEISHTTATDGCLTLENFSQWSLVFRCSIWPTLIQGADKHQLADPPSISPATIASASPTPVPAAQSAVLYTRSPPACTANGDHATRETVAVNTCIQTQYDNIQIVTPAICANGTRAKLARFSDSYCNEPISLSHADIHDCDLNRCIATTASTPTAWEINSVEFWCEGSLSSTQPPAYSLPSASPQPVPSPHRQLPGAISQPYYSSGYSQYSYGYGYPQQDPLIKEVEPDKCHYVQYSQLKVYSPGLCSNGSTPRLAQHMYSDCSDAPFEILELTPDNLYVDIRSSNLRAFSLQCTGETTQSNRWSYWSLPSCHSCNQYRYHSDTGRWSCSGSALQLCVSC